MPSLPDTVGKPLPDGAALAATYSGGYYDDPVAILEQYEAYREYVADHQHASRATIAAVIDAPEGRVRSWQDGSLPDPVRIVVDAQNRGWLPLEYDTDRFDAANVLAAAVFAGGSIAESWVPRWHLEDDRVEKVLTEALTTLGLNWRVDRTGEQGRATELVPSEGSTLLGRLLVAMGAPAGPKATGEISLPDYLDAAPAASRGRFVRVYLRIRASIVPEREGSWMQLREERPGAHLDDLARLIRSVLPNRGGPAPVTRSDKNIYIRQSAVEALFGTDRPEDRAIV